MSDGDSADFPCPGSSDRVSGLASARGPSRFPVRTITALSLFCLWGLAAGGETDKGLDLDSALTAMPDRIKTPDRWALLIGVSDYAD